MVRSEIMASAKVQRFDVLAYCVMPDHCHLLLQGQSDESQLLPLIKRLKQKTSYAARNLVAGALWQQSFHDRVLRRTEDLMVTARYVLENPVKAGLVDQATKWHKDGPEGSSLHGIEKLDA